jgi:uncharacterized protein YhfF
MADDPASLPAAEFAFPGPLRDRLVAAILSGEKTATASLVLEYEVEGERLPQAGDRGALVDSSGRRLAVLETTEVRVLRAADVDEAFARDEGEGFESVGDWREAHRRFWESEQYRAAVRRPDFELTDDELVVAERFRLVERLPGPQD